MKGKLTVQKKGEVLSTYKNDFKYEVQNLSGAVYEVYAAEDIYTADFQKDASAIIVTVILSKEYSFTSFLKLLIILSSVFSSLGLGTFPNLPQFIICL